MDVCFMFNGNSTDCSFADIFSLTDVTITYHFEGSILFPPNIKRITSYGFSGTLNLPQCSDVHLVVDNVPEVLNTAAITHIYFKKGSYLEWIKVLNDYENLKQVTFEGYTDKALILKKSIKGQPKSKPTRVASHNF